MKVVIAPDSFKECMSSPQVAAAMAAGVKARWPEAQVLEIPLADGGEGTWKVLASALEASVSEAIVHDPLGRSVRAQFAVKGDTAIIEAAQAVGLSLLSPCERNPLTASSAGLGELMLTAYDKGCRHFIVGLGGTATCDGGTGLFSVPGIERLKGATFELLCDVDAPFIGPRGAARVFAPQKGAGPEAVEVLEERMKEQAARILKETGVDISYVPGAGAAGGLAGAMMAVLGARITRGIDRVLDLVHFHEAIQDTHLIITGEGKSDAQTLMGKVPMGVLQNAAGIPVALLSGRIEDRTALEQAGFHSVIEVSPRHLSSEIALNPQVAAENLFKAVSAIEW